MDKEGSKRVEIADVDDKRQLTAIFAGKPSGEFLPPQIIYKGKTDKCLPKIDCPSDWHTTFSYNHWANEKTTMDYINFILLPYVKKKHEELKNTAALTLAIFEWFREQCTKSVLDLLEENNIRIAIAAKCTDRLRPLDISINKKVKEFLHGKFQSWYSDQLCKKI